MLHNNIIYLINFIINNNNNNKLRFKDKENKLKEKI